MPNPRLPGAPLTPAPPESAWRLLARAVDPRRSLVAGLTWLVVALAASFALAASLWVGGVARRIVVQQHVRRLVLETDQLAADVAQAAAARLAAINAAEHSVPYAEALDYLTATYPDQEWLAAVAPAAGETPSGERPWIGMVGRLPPADGRWLGDLGVPWKDRDGRTRGVLVARLTRRWALPESGPADAALEFPDSTRTWILDEHAVIRVGPPALANHPWTGVVLEDPAPLDLAGSSGGVRASPAGAGRDALRYERLADGSTALVAVAPLALGPADGLAGWEVRLTEPKAAVYQRADALAARILWISLCLGVATALVGAWGARHLTNRLRRLTRSAASVGRNEVVRIEVPAGRDEVAQLAAVLAKVLDDLRQERGELLALSSELERRVLVRTREVERLAEEARYAAIARERLNMARELHDTLAHSMMAMLSEIRLLRKLEAHDPGALAGELARAEEVARDGLAEARTAITRMRFNAVRDTGLGPALDQLLQRFLDRAALTGEFSADPAAAHVGDQRAEILFRMAEEALRNIERHAAATSVSVALERVGGSDLRLRISDDGIGFDPLREYPGHYGLVGLKEQAALIGADLVIDSGGQRGTTLSITLRIAPEVL